MKKIFLMFNVMCVLAMSILLMSCDLITDKSKIYDQDSLIAQRRDSYSFGNKVGNGEEGNEHVSFTFSSFTGKITLWKIRVIEDCELIVTVTLTTTKGKSKICLIDTDKKVETLVEGTEEKSITLNLSEGDNFISFVGKHGAGSINITVECDNPLISIKKETEMKWN